jgi:hypothetical protein
LTFKKPAGNGRVDSNFCPAQAFRVEFTVLASSDNLSLNMGECNACQEKVRESLENKRADRNSWTRLRDRQDE